MEKFSAFRDPGTGIQPFLTPVPPVGSDILKNVLLPFGFVLGVIRTALILLLTILYAVLVEGLCKTLVPVPPLHRTISHLITAVVLRLTLFFAGLVWIPVEHVTSKRGRGAKATESWNPQAGDVIVSNWASWIEILWLAIRFNPIFIVPVTSSVDLSVTSRSSPITSTPGRRTGTGSAAISSPNARTSTPRARILGFRRVSLLSIVARTGTTPENGDTVTDYPSFEKMRSEADRPVIVFPECTTSNGRGLLKFADVFKGIDVPVKKFKIFVMCVRYDPPTSLAPTLSHSIPSSFLNPLPHIFKLTSSLVPLTLSIRLLAPSDSPSSGSFLVSDFLTGGACDDPLSEICAALISQIGKFKRTGMAWEDKTAFLQFYNGKQK